MRQTPTTAPPMAGSTANTCEYVIRYVLECECGNRLYAQTGEAGASLVCPHCNRIVNVPALSVLRDRFPSERLRLVGPHGLRRFQFSIRQMLVLTTVCAAVLAVLKVLGLQLLLDGLLVTLIAFAIGESIVYHLKRFQSP